MKDESKWTFEAKKKSGDKYELIAHLKLPDHWHIYAFKPGGDGSLYPPAFTFSKNAAVKLTGAVKEKGKLLTEVLVPGDPKVNMYKGTVDYVQEATIAANTKITGTYTYQICNDEMCLPPANKKFAITVTDAGGTAAATAAPDTASVAATQPAAADTNARTVIAEGGPTTAKADSAAKPATTAVVKEEEKKSLPWLFLAAFLGGLAAVLTPCVYSMIPITVSFFTKRSKTRKEGIRNALYYSLSIIIIFTTTIIIITTITINDTIIYQWPSSVSSST